jgi:hypothetical protein
MVFLGHLSALCCFDELVDKLPTCFRAWWMDLGGGTHCPGLSGCVVPIYRI